MSQLADAAAVKIGVMDRLLGKERVAHLPGEIGIWIFILGDMTLYLVLFWAFMVDRSTKVEFFTSCQQVLHPNIGGINMLILLVSSVAVALSVMALRSKMFKKQVPILLSFAFLCGVAFIFNKYIEYSDLLSMGITPLINTFFTWYYLLTVLHLLHLVGGMGCLIYMFKVSKKPENSEADIRGCESAGCFWHAVDLLWVCIFPILYLMR